MKLVLLGGDGQVGWELRRALAPLGELWVLDRRGAGEACGDLEKPDSLMRALRRLEPDVIVNAAAYTDVDRAESDPARAADVNASAPALLAEEAKRLGALLVHYSTDYVFDGSGTRPWREDDPAAPINVYGRTKWEGEQRIRESGCRHLILRTQWIFSVRRRNFLRTVLAAAAERDRLAVVDDQIGAPTGAELVADVTAHALRSLADRPESAGTYHVAARGETSRCGYARFAVGHARRVGLPLRLREDAIVPIGSDALSAAACRPLNGRLATGRLELTFGLRMPDWRIGVVRAIAELGRMNRGELQREEPPT